MPLRLGEPPDPSATRSRRARSPGGNAASARASAGRSRTRSAGGHVAESLGILAQRRFASLAHRFPRLARRSRRPRQGHRRRDGQQLGDRANDSTNGSLPDHRPPAHRTMDGARARRARRPAFRPRAPTPPAPYKTRRPSHARHPQTTSLGPARRFLAQLRRESVGSASNRACLIPLRAGLSGQRASAPIGQIELRAPAREAIQLQNPAPAWRTVKRSASRSQSSPPAPAVRVPDVSPFTHNDCRDRDK